MKTSTTDFQSERHLRSFHLLDLCSLPRFRPSAHLRFILSFPGAGTNQGMVQEAEELRASGKHEAAEETMNRARKLRHQLAERMGRRGRSRSAVPRPASQQDFLIKSAGPSLRPASHDRVHSSGSGKYGNGRVMQTRNLPMSSGN